MPFKKGEGRKALNLTENEIRYAQENSKSAHGASRFLNVDYDTYKKYAKMYIDSATGKSLFDLKKNQSGKGIRKLGKAYAHNHLERLQPIINGERPDYKGTGLKRRLIKAMVLEEKCDVCGYEQRRPFDYTVPLLLDWIDGDKTNHLLANLRLLCHNCYYMEVGSIHGGRPKNWIY
jgi:hypothetical protein